MDKQQQDLYTELLADLKIEAVEHRDIFTKKLLELEQTDASNSKHITEIMFREMHSLKGAARAVKLSDIERLCQAVEGVMSLLKTDQLTINTSIADLLHETVDVLDELLDAIDDQKNPELSYKVDQLVNRLEIIEKGDVKKTKTTLGFKELASKMAKKKQPLPSPTKNSSSPEIKPTKKSLKAKKAKNETVRITTQKLSHILTQAEELITAKAMLQDEIDRMRRLKDEHRHQIEHSEQQLLQLSKANNTDEKREMTPYFLQQREYAKHIQQEFTEMIATSKQRSKSFSRMIDDLLIDIRTSLLAPFTSLMELLPKTVRDLARSVNKTIQFESTGHEVEIDRRILEEIKDPILHLVRNCVDHGIETAKERETKGKPSAGHIKLAISKTENREIHIKISDDGAGIDARKLVASAIKHGVTSAEAAEKMTHHEKLKFIFHSGISTSTQVTNISGRGLGMAIVAEKVESLGGQINVQSVVDIGTTFTLILPLTLTTFRGVMVRCADQYFMINTTTVERVIRYKRSDIRIVNDREAIVVADETIGLVALSDILGIQNTDLAKDTNPYMSVIILNIAQKKLAYQVHEIMGEHEGIVKDLGPLLQNIKNISGATILGNGQVVPVLDTHDLLHLSETHNAQPTQKPDTRNDDAQEQKKKVLVAEDSLTSRSLLRNILEVANYEVKTAVDGAEAYKFLCHESFDLLVSDIEMPNLTGLELVTKVRQTEGIQSLPVILITSLSSPEDKQRGMEAGADAYFIKSSFDQSNLVQIVQQLI